MSLVQIYECDHCGRRSEGTRGRPPERWGTCRFRPGVITPPLGTAAGRDKSDRHFCDQPECNLAAERFVREENERRGP